MCYILQLFYISINWDVQISIKSKGGHVNWRRNMHKKIVYIINHNCYKYHVLYYKQNKKLFVMMLCIFDKINPPRPALFLSPLPLICVLDVLCITPFSNHFRYILNLKNQSFTNYKLLYIYYNLFSEISIFNIFFLVLSIFK